MNSGEKIHFSTHSRRLFSKFSAIQSKGLSLSRKLFGLFILIFSLISSPRNPSKFIFILCHRNSFCSGFRLCLHLQPFPIYIFPSFIRFCTSLADESCSQARDSRRWHFKPFLLHILGCLHKSSPGAEFVECWLANSQRFMTRNSNSTDASCFKILLIDFHIHDRRKCFISKPKTSFQWGTRLIQLFIIAAS